MRSSRCASLRRASACSPSSIFFTLQTANFWSPQTMTAISTVASTIGIVAVGVTMLMISGEFDLSVGQNFAFTPIIWAILFVTQRHERVAGACDRARLRDLGRARQRVRHHRLRHPLLHHHARHVLRAAGAEQSPDQRASADHVRPQRRRCRCSGARIGKTPFYMPLVWMFVIAIGILVRADAPALRQLDVRDRRQGRAGEGHGRADGAR